MTADNIIEIEAGFTKCRSCRHFKPTALFDLCMHAASRYLALGEIDYHTIGHMRSIGACRADAMHYEPQQS